MRDLLYLLGTLGFFLVMLGYVRACERLGASVNSERPGAPDDR